MLVVVSEGASNSNANKSIVHETYIFTKDMGNTDLTEVIKVHFKNAFRASDQNLATVDQIWQASDSEPSHEVFNNSSEVTITSGKPLKLGEGYELAIKSIDIDGKRMYLELSKNGNVIDSAMIIPPQDVSDTYIYSKYQDSVGPVEVIKVHFKNSFRGTDQDLAAVDQIWQVSDRNYSQMIINSSLNRSITSGTPLKLADGYELAIKSTDIDGNKVYVELSKNETVIDLAQIMPTNAEADTYTYTNYLNNTDGVETIKVHFKNAFRGVDQNLATLDRVWQLSDTNSSNVIINDSHEATITIGTSTKLEEGYELAIKSIDIDGNKVYVELSKDGAVVDSAVIITVPKVDDIYTFTKDIGRANDTEVIKVHFKNAFRGSDQNLVTLDRVWQLSDTNSSNVIINDSHEATITSGTSIKLEEGYELAIKSIDIDGNKVYVELSKDGAVVDFAVIITIPKVDDIYTFTKDIGRAKDTEVIKVHFKNAFRGSDQNLATVDQIWQVSDSNPSLVIFNKSRSVTITSGTPLKLGEGYELAIKSIGIYENKVYVELSKNGNVIDSAVIIPVSWYHDKISDLIAQGRYDEAVRAYRASMLKNKGVAFYDQGEYDEAIKAFDMAIEIDPQFTDAWNDKGNALYYLGKYDEAVKAYDMAIEIYPQNADVWSNKAIVLDHLSRYDDAIRSYNKASEIDETQNSSVVRKGKDHYDNGEYATAIKYYDAAIKRDPKDEYAWYNKGMALRMLHRNSEADAAFTEARELGYSGSMTLLEMSGLYESNA
ncbi:MAG: S-layer protein domain-containing protein [Methanothrix sp.]|nr:S-layer protein domain-containing protein [Methanothrix sp.]